MAWTPCDTRYNISRHIIPFMQDAPFYAELSRNIHKVATHDLPTAGVTFDRRNDEITLLYNPCFMGGGSYTTRSGKLVTEAGLSGWETRGLLRHEFDHLVYGHLTARQRKPFDDWNIATDLAINSIIVTHPGKPRELDPTETSSPLPRSALIPGRRPWVDPEKLDIMQPFQKKAYEKLAAFIEGLPPMKSSEFYFQQLSEFRKDNSDSLSDDIKIVIGPMDSHEGWGEDLGDLSDEEREYIEGKVKSIVEKAVRHADSHHDGWGSIPAELREEIRRSVSNYVNWRAVLRQFTGMIVRGQRSKTIKRINKRYPYIHAGVKRGYTAKLLVAIDMSGSVDDQMLELFFGELSTLTRKVDITVLPFDCSLSERDMFEWKKGTCPELKRVRTGGTNFDAPTDFVNDPKNRGRWDGMLICTDGEAPAPKACRIKRGWILGKGCKLQFNSDELQVFVTKDQQLTGAWR